MPIHPSRTADVQPSFLRDDDLARGRDDTRKVPVGMIGSEIIRIEAAEFYADVCDKTIRKWVKQDGIGRQSSENAPLQISLPALLMRVDGQMETLERLRIGDRDHPSVVFYLLRAIRLQEEVQIDLQRRRTVMIRTDIRQKAAQTSK